MMDVCCYLKARTFLMVNPTPNKQRSNKIYAKGKTNLDYPSKEAITAIFIVEIDELEVDGEKCSFAFHNSLYPWGLQGPYTIQ